MNHEEKRQLVEALTRFMQTENLSHRQRDRVRGVQKMIVASTEELVGFQEWIGKLGTQGVIG